VHAFRALKNSVAGGALAFSLALTGGAMAATPFKLGAYLGNPNGSSPAQETVFETNYQSFSTAMDVQPKMLLAYVDYTQPVTAWPSNASWQAWSNAQSPVARALVPVIGFPMASIASGAPTADAQFQAFAAGTYDTEIKGVVNAWVQQGFTNLVFRPGWEMNINGPTYAGDSAQAQADWVAAFKHIVTVMKKAAKAAKATVRVVWNPNATNYSNANAINSLYPGDSYVDIVGIDFYADMYPYSDGGSPATYHDWDTGEEDTSISEFMQDPVNRAHYWSYPAATKWSSDSSGGHCTSLDMLLQFALNHKKPVAIPETGAGNSNGGHDVKDDPTFPQWLATQLNGVIAAGGKVAFVAIWDSNADGNYEYSYAADDKPLESAAWRQYFGKISQAQASIK
jgi:hypothetical protein